MTNAEISSAEPCTVAGLEVGAVLIAPTFRIGPQDVVDYERSAFVHEGGVEGLQRLQQLVPRSRGPSACPPALVLSRAAGSVLDALGRRDHPLTVRNVGRLRVLATPVLGEPLTPVATVRFLTGERQSDAHLTLAVEVRRRGGRVLATLEIGVQLSPPTPVDGTDARHAA